MDPMLVRPPHADTEEPYCVTYARGRGGGGGGGGGGPAPYGQRHKFLHHRPHFSLTLILVGCRFRDLLL